MNLSIRESRLEARKNQAIEALSVQFSRNAMPVEEYERLVDYINRLESEREMAVVEKIVEETALYAGDIPGKAAAPAVSHPDGDISKRRKLTLLASRETSGEVLCRERKFLSLLGNHTITIQSGDLPPGQTRVNIVSFLGLTTIIVPPEVKVIIEATPILGGVFVWPGVASQKKPGSPELVITGGAYLGNITVRAGT
ncbi:MAG: cell wall-active antibiotics response protein [Treponema sp.]|jgi:hypothetical protein|nr:cell wall-active antibiotics response protein [Treponema sp.]